MDTVCAVSSAHCSAYKYKDVLSGNISTVEVCKQSLPPHAQK